MTKKITITAISLALYIILKTIIPTIVIIPGVLQINFAIIFLPLLGMLLGKNKGFIIGIAADLISFMLFPTVFNPVFMLNEGLLGYLGGLLFHDKDLTFAQISWRSILLCYFGIVLLNTLALAFQFTILTANVQKLVPLFTTSLWMRLASSTFIYIPLLISIIYFPRKQWNYLQNSLKIGRAHV